MRTLLVAALCAVLAACGGSSSVETQSAEPAALTGRYLASPETGIARIGDVSIERGGLVFASGVILYTRVLEPRNTYDRIARDGVTYAAVASGTPDMIVELRRVTEQRWGQGAQGLCDGEAPAYVALAYGPRATRVTLLAFSGDEPPGPNATRSRLCGAFVYVAPDGARTRQGVLLQ